MSFIFVSTESTTLLRSLFSNLILKTSSYNPNNMSDDQRPFLPKSENSTNRTQLLKPKRWKWWFLVSMNVAVALLSQSSGILLVRFYYAEGGNSKWLITLAQTMAFPLLFIPISLFPSFSNDRNSTTSVLVLGSIYVLLGTLYGGSTVLFSIGLSYLSASTYSLICATQLAFIAIFSYFINSQKFTALIVNSVAVLSLSAALVTVNEDPQEPSGDSKVNYLIGFTCTVFASALYSLLLSLMQYSFQRVLKRQTFSVVIETQAYVSLVATCMSLIGLFASGDWRVLRTEMGSFGTGRVSYALTLVSTAVAWQVYAVCSTGLIFLVSSLFTSAISTLSLVVNPIAAVIVFRDNMNGVKIIALLMAIWGFTSYVYQNYLDQDNDDDNATRTSSTYLIESQNESSC